MKNKKTRSVVYYLVFFTQFGLNMMIPPLFCTGIAWWLAKRFSWGNWVVLIGILLGVATAGVNLWKFAMYTQQQAKESERDKRK